jgi:hypothetical protein
LADYSEIFGKDVLFEKLQELPKPDVIFGFPPCESWSVATSMTNGNASWVTQRINTLFGEHVCENRFSLRDKKSYEHGMMKITNEKSKGYFYKSFYKRINGELCAFNTTRIIETYKPKIWIIENPQSSRIWDYLTEICDFQGVKNVAHYHASDIDNFGKKPTIFFSNLNLNLRKSYEVSKIISAAKKQGDERKEKKTYNDRSAIPEKLLKEFLEKCLTKIKKENDR